LDVFKGADELSNTSLKWLLKNSRLEVSLEAIFVSTPDAYFSNLICLYAIDELRHYLLIGRGKLQLLIGKTCKLCDKWWELMTRAKLNSRIESIKLLVLWVGDNNAN